MNGITDTHIFVWRAMPAIQCTRRLFHSYLHQTTKISFQFLRIYKILRSLLESYMYMYFNALALARPLGIRSQWRCGLGLCNIIWCCWQNLLHILHDSWFVIGFKQQCTQAKYIISARPRLAKYTIGICFETAKKTKAFECFLTGFQHSLWQFSTNGNLYLLKSWLWLAAVACVVRWPISKALLNDIWLTCFTRMCN